MYYDSGYLLIVLLSLVLGLGTQAYIKSSYAKWSKVDNSSGMSGAQAARRMLDSEGLTSVSIERIGGVLSDHFDPRSNVLRLSENVYDGRSVAAAAVACHEAGHAVQHARGYVPAKIRGALVPAASFGSNAWVIFLMLGIFLNVTGLIWVGIVMFSFAVVFQVVTLPVEFNASGRALKQFSAVNGPGGGVEYGGAQTVLRAAALTYVAAALVSVLQLLRLIGIARRD